MLSVDDTAAGPHHTFLNHERIVLQAPFEKAVNYLSVSPAARATH